MPPGTAVEKPEPSAFLRSDSEESASSEAVGGPESGGRGCSSLSPVRVSDKEPEIIPFVEMKNVNANSISNEKQSLRQFTAGQSPGEPPLN